MYDGHAGLDLFNMPIPKTTTEYDRGCELFRDKESNELRARSDMHHKVYGLIDGHGISACVANVWRAICFANFASQGLWYFTQPDEAGAGSSIKCDNERFR